MLDLMKSEQIVESMIEDGRRIVDAAIATYKPIAILAGFSGGDDSVVTTHFARTYYDAFALHCETSIGMEKTQQHVASTCSRLGCDLRRELATPEGPSDTVDPKSLPAGVWTDGNTAYEEFVLNFGFPSRGQHHRMYQRLKERPIAAVQRELKIGRPRNSTILIISGIRHDESSIRAGYKRDTMKEPSTSRVWVNPFYWRSVTDFELYRQEFGLPRNPVKARIGISGECLCGAYAKPIERGAIRSVEPIMADYMDNLEARVSSNGFPWGWGEKIPKWWSDARKGQGFLFDSHADEASFRPMCVGCDRL